jgi:hypothetical protein
MSSRINTLSLLVIHFGYCCNTQMGALLAEEGDVA